LVQKYPHDGGFLVLHFDVGSSVGGLSDTFVGAAVGLLVFFHEMVLVSWAENQFVQELA
jgi:hypothetical protein